MIRKLTLTVLIVIAAANLAVAKAKINPYIEDPAAEWGDVSDPAAIVGWDALAAQAGRLESDTDVDAFSLSFPAAETDWQFQIIVPVCDDHFETFFPSVALIGAGLETSEAGALPFDLPEGMGAVIFSEDHYQEQYVEHGHRSIMPSNFVNGGETYFNTSRSIDIPAAGDYMLAVFEPDGNPGAYILQTGSVGDAIVERPIDELQAAYDDLFSGSWMGEDGCSTASSPIAMMVASELTAMGQS